MKEDLLNRENIKRATKSRASLRSILSIYPLYFRSLRSVPFDRPVSSAAVNACRNAIMAASGGSGASTASNAVLCSASTAAAASADGGSVSPATDAAGD